MAASGHGPGDEQYESWRNETVAGSVSGTGHAQARGAARWNTSGPVTLDDVVLAAGVSTATVSRVINNFTRVADATRRSVLNASIYLAMSRLMLRRLARS
jgi:hypothetical protein